MAAVPLGKITVAAAGTPQRIVATRTPAQSVIVQAWPENTGNVYIGLSNMVAATGVGVLFIIPAPTADNIPSFDWGIPLAPAGLNVADYYLDVDTNGEAALVTYEVQ